MRKLQRSSVVLVVESGFIFLLIVEIGNWIPSRFLPGPNIDIEALFGILFELLLAPLLAGGWVSVWQARESSLSWIIGGVLGLVLVNIVTTGGYDYFYLLPIGIVAWLGGKLGRRLKRRFQMRSSELQ